MQNCNIYIYIHTYKYYYTTLPVTAIGPDDPSGLTRIYYLTHTTNPRENTYTSLRTYTKKRLYLLSTEVSKEKMTSWCMYIVY